LEIRIKRVILTGQTEQRDELKWQAAKLGNRNEPAGLRIELDILVEEYGRLRKEITRLQLQDEGVGRPEPDGADAKLDAILRELAALRKDVQELKAQKK
jgi:hypothetical protein